MREAAAVQAIVESADTNAGTLDELLVARQEPVRAVRPQFDGVRVGTLVAFKGETIPLVIFDGQPGSAALPARATLDLGPSHIGGEVVLMFERGDPELPIIIACLGRHEFSPLSRSKGRVEVDADGERMVVSARHQLVLRCGKASITLTHAGKVLIQGAFVLSRSSGVNRIKGGSVEIN